jgi:hypothetical protein
MQIDVISGIRPGCRVSIFGESEFGCTSLRLICIPSSVGKMGTKCFVYCRQLVTVTFEPSSKLSILPEATFGGFISLESICIPSSVETIST